MQKTRCAWVTSSPLYIDYHDNEWGKPLYDNQKLFELLCLEGMQAGLSWLTILKKRPAYRDAFANFNPDRIVRFDEKQIEKLMLNEGIIRNRLKIQAIVNNAQATLELQEQGLSLSSFLWDFVDNSPIINQWQTAAEVPAQTHHSDKLAKALKRRGFKFIGSTICYAFMQAAGLVNDHTQDCFCRA